MESCFHSGTNRAFNGLTLLLPGLKSRQLRSKHPKFDGIDFDAASFSFGNVYGGFHANIPSNTLSRFGTWSGTASTVTLGSGGAGPDLAIGNTYRIQLLVADGRGGLSGRTIQVDGLDQGTYATGVGGRTWGDFLLVTGTFTADGLSQSFTMEAFNTNGSSAGGQLNALLVHDVTGVPDGGSTALLMGLSLLGFVPVRRFLLRKA